MSKQLIRNQADQLLNYLQFFNLVTFGAILKTYWLVGLQSLETQD